MREQGNVNYGDDGESRSYSIQIDPFFKFTILTTGNSLFRFSPATLLAPTSTGAPRATRSAIGSGARGRRPGPSEGPRAGRRRRARASISQKLKADAAAVTQEICARVPRGRRGRGGASRATRSGDRTRRSGRRRRRRTRRGRARGGSRRRRRSPPARRAAPSPWRRPRGAGRRSGPRVAPARRRPTPSTPSFLL